MNAKPVSEVTADAAKLLSDAVVNVTTEAIKPSLNPFKAELAGATKRLEDRVEELGQIAADQDEALGNLDAHIAGALEATARQQAAFDEAVKAVRTVSGDLSLDAQDAAARQQAAADQVVTAIREIAGDLGATTRDLAELTRQLANFRRRLTVSIAIGTLGLIAGAIALVLILR